eukprot:GHRQ01033690.1.p2 GENE.GHRQ01033690.1~~GHRQ01033690.1.p2  ORF type:complete len:154 (+),score=73.47 GHRQ01033690.1:51-464(+)
MSQDTDPFDEDYVAEDEAVDPEDEGYTTGCSSGDGGKDENEEYFGQHMDLDSLLANMAQPQAGDDPQQLQPYQILRQQRHQQQQHEQGGGQGGDGGAKGSRRQGVGATDSDEDWDANRPLELTSTSEPKRKMNKKKK